MSYLCYLCLFEYSGLQHILCCVFVLFVFVYVASFSGLSFLLALRYSLMFMCPVSYVPYVTSFSGLSFFLALQYSLMFMCPVSCVPYRMLPVSLDCLFYWPFGIL